MIQSPMLDWTTWMPATCLPLDCFCEGDAGGVLRQPINTISNLAFIFVGAWIWTRAKNNLGRTFAVLLAIIGLASGFYHASLSFVGQTLDVVAIFLLPSLMIVDNIAYETKRPFLSLAWVFVLGNALFFALIVFVPDLRRPLVAVFSLALVLSERRARRERNLNLLGAALGCFFLSFMIWIPDRFQWVCSPSLPPLGHAIWHLLNATTAGILFLYLDSDRDGIRQSSA